MRNKRINLTLNEEEYEAYKRLQEKYKHNWSKYIGKIIIFVDKILTKTAKEMSNRISKEGLMNTTTNQYQNTVKDIVKELSQEVLKKANEDLAKTLEKKYSNQEKNFYTYKNEKTKEKDKNNENGSKH